MSLGGALRVVFAEKESEYEPLMMWFGPQDEVARAVPEAAPKKGCLTMLFALLLLLVSIELF
jgi:hypothetical protein